jgi:cytochrome c
MERALRQPWRLLVPAAIIAVSLVLSACGGQATPTPLPTQPPVVKQPAPVTQQAAPTQPAAATQAPGAPTKAPAAATQPAAPGKAAGDPAAGQQAIGRYGCGGCHVIPGVQGAAGTVGPSLAGFAGRNVIAGTSVNNTPENLVRWIMDPQSVKPGTQMPNLGVNQADAQNIAAYLLTLR